MHTQTTCFIQDAAPRFERVNNNLSESLEDVDIDSDPADDFASVSHEDDDEEEEEEGDLDLLAPLRNQIVNIGDHIKVRKGVIGGKFKCDHNGCRMVEESGSL